jgi:hypothetical protein
MENGLFGLFLEWLRSNPGAERMLQQREEQQAIPYYLKNLARVEELNRLGALQQTEPETTAAPIISQSTQIPVPTNTEVTPTEVPSTSSATYVSPDVSENYAKALDMAETAQQDQNIFRDPEEAYAYSAGVYTPAATRLKLTGKALGDMIAKQIRDQWAKEDIPDPNKIIAENNRRFAEQQKHNKTSARKPSRYTKDYTAEDDAIVRESIKDIYALADAEVQNSKPTSVQTRIKNEPRRVANRIYERYL